VYTVEASLCGTERVGHFSAWDLIRLGKEICVGLVAFYPSVSQRESPFYSEGLDVEGLSAAYQAGKSSDGPADCEERTLMLSILSEETYLWRQLYRSEAVTGLGQLLLTESAMNEIFGSGLDPRCTIECESAAVVVQTRGDDAAGDFCGSSRANKTKAKEKRNAAKKPPIAEECQAVVEVGVKEPTQQVPPHSAALFVVSGSSQNSTSSADVLPNGATSLSRRHSGFGLTSLRLGEDFVAKSQPCSGGGEDAKIKRLIRPSTGPGKTQMPPLKNKQVGSGAPAPSKGIVESILHQYLAETSPKLRKDDDIYLGPVKREKTIPKALSTGEKKMALSGKRTTEERGGVVINGSIIIDRKNQSADVLQTDSTKAVRIRVHEF
jgi:hypothetical protein